jgi:hypothetical protein
MSVERAAEFLKAISADEKWRKLASGWNLDELKQAAGELKASGVLSDAELEGAAGGACIWYEGCFGHF